MHKLLPALPIALLLGAGVAGAQQNYTPGDPPSRLERGTQAPAHSIPLTGAHDVAWAQDGRPVHLRGRIVRQQGQDQYMFADPSGMVLIGIDSKLLNGRKLPAGTLVEIRGEVDTRIEKAPKVEVKSVMVLAARSSNKLQATSYRLQATEG
jgi:uncharacterized protein (TIGR00156 family)